MTLQKESRIDQGDVMLDYVHIHDGLDPTEIRDFAGGRFIKGKSAIDLARTYRERKHNFTGLSFWARGLCSPPLGGRTNWGRVSDPPAASSGSILKAPGSAGGYLPLKGGPPALPGWQ